MSRKLPLAAIFVIKSEAVPLFVNLTLLVGLAVPTSCAAKLRLAGESVTIGDGAVAVPVSATV